MKETRHGIRSGLELGLVPNELFDPISYSIIKFIIASNKRINCNRKCNAENRFMVGFVTTTSLHIILILLIVFQGKG